MTGQCIWASKKLPWNMDNFQVKVSQVEEPSSLTSVQFLGLAEVCQVLVVGEHLHWKGGTVEIVSPRLQGSDNSKKLLIVDIIVLFCRDE